MKIILISQSEFFENLFFSEMKESKRSYISIPKIEPEIFNEILFFLYTGNIKDQEEEEEEKNQIIKEEGRRNLNYEKLIKILYSSDYLQIYGLIDLCFAYLMQCSNLFLNSIDFLNLNEGLLIYYLKSNFLLLDEFNLFKKLIEWSKFQCLKFKIKNSNENIKEILNPLLFHLRLTLLKDKIKEIESCPFVSKEFLIYFYKTLIKKKDTIEVSREFF